MVEVEGVVTHKLAQLVVGVGLLADVGAVLVGEGRVEDVQRVVVQVRELSAVDVIVTEETTCLPHVAHKDTAHHRRAGRRLAELCGVVHPLILLNHRRDVRGADVQNGLGVHEDLIRGEASGSHTEVPCLGDEAVGGAGDVTVSDGEEELDDLPCAA